MTNHRARRNIAAAVLTAAAMLAVSSSAIAGAAPKGGDPSTTSGTRCNPRKQACSSDTTAPAVQIDTPHAGDVVADSFTVAGRASDNIAVAFVDVRVADAPWQRVSGTGTWTGTVEAPAVSGASVTVTARVTDSSGNAASTAVVVETAPPPVEEDPPPPGDDPGNGGGSADDTIVSDPSARYGMSPLARTRLATWGSLTGILYTEPVTDRRAMWFRDAATGSTAIVDLPPGSAGGWTYAALQMTSARDLWILGGSGPMTLRHYVLSGSPLPSAATLVETRSFGDADSRPGDLVALRNGGLVATWHQQGADGRPQGQFVAHRNASGAWSQLPALTFMPTHSSDQVLAQHPVDDSVWLFSNPDAWGAIGAARLVERNGTLSVDWTDGLYIFSNNAGAHAPDPENPDLAVAADPSTGTIALAYQSADRRVFSSGNQMRIGSRIAVARIAADRSVTAVVGTDYAERVSDVGLIVAGGATLISYRPVDPDDLSFDEVRVATHRDGAWTSPQTLGTGTGEVVTYAEGRAELSTVLADGKIHLFRL